MINRDKWDHCQAFGHEYKDHTGEPLGYCVYCGEPDTTTNGAHASMC